MEHKLSKKVVNISKTQEYGPVYGPRWFTIVYDSLRFEAANIETCNPKSKKNIKTTRKKNRAVDCLRGLLGPMCLSEGQLPSSSDLPTRIRRICARNLSWSSRRRGCRCADMPVRKKLKRPGLPMRRRGVSACVCDLTSDQEGYEEDDEEECGGGGCTRGRKRGRGGGGGRVAAAGRPS